MFYCDKINSYRVVKLANKMKLVELGGEYGVTVYSCVAGYIEQLIEKRSHQINERRIIKMKGYTEHRTK